MERYVEDRRWEVSCISLALGGMRPASGDFALVEAAWLRGQAAVAVSSVVVEGAHVSACVVVGEG